MLQPNIQDYKNSHTSNPYEPTTYLDNLSRRLFLLNDAKQKCDHHRVKYLATQIILKHPDSIIAWQSLAESLLITEGPLYALQISKIIKKLFPDTDITEKLDNKIKHIKNNISTEDK